MGPSVQGILSICSNGSASLNKMAPFANIVKTLKNLLQNQESFKAQFYYRALGTPGHPIYLNDDPRMTVDLFMARSN